ncbi:MAG TPA: zf-HC2 domain-containing protein [Nitrospira sp.]|nr:zf-HC2 domain-containing protein [Nitrospira sp.]
MTHESSKSIHGEISCREIVEWTAAYLDEHVGEDRKQQIALHLAACAGCEEYVKQIVSVRDLVRLLPQAVDSPAESEQARRAVATRLYRP